MMFTHVLLIFCLYKSASVTPVIGESYDHKFNVSLPYLFCLRICNNPDPVFRHSKVTCLLEDLCKIFLHALFVLFTD